jgi:hypothetical protein
MKEKMSCQYASSSLLFFKIADILIEDFMLSLPTPYFSLHQLKALF